MSYTISQVAQMMGVTPSTLRYYDKEGLQPNVKRVNGIRVFEDTDFPWLRILNCLKGTGMPIRQIKKYVDLCAEGDATLEQRYAIIKEQRQHVLDQIEQLNFYLKELDYKDTTKKQSRPVPKKPSIIPTASLIYPWTRFQE